MLQINRQKLIIGGIAGVVIIVLAIGGYFLWTNYGQPQEVSTREPVDIVGDFYKSWLDATIATSTSPYEEGLADTPILSKELRKHIQEVRAKVGTDPVLCQTTTPEDVALRIVSTTEEQTEILVTARRSESTEQALVTLLALNGGWYINTIQCSPGEFGPEREFSFDREGYLLKNVPAPLNAKYWHLIFEENGELGHNAPLLIGPESTCSDLNGNTAPCNIDTFTEASKAHVQGQMTELGVQVTRIQLVK